MTRKDFVAEKGYRELDISCCATCKHLGFNEEFMETFCSLACQTVSHVGICDSYEGVGI
jgi:hypothetical protein